MFFFLIYFFYQKLDLSYKRLKIPALSYWILFTWLCASVIKQDFGFASPFYFFLYFDINSLSFFKKKNNQEILCNNQLCENNK